VQAHDDADFAASAGFLAVSGVSTMVAVIAVTDPEPTSQRD